MKTTNKHLLKLSKEIAQKELKEHLKLYRDVIPNAYEKENTPEAKEAYLKQQTQFIYTELSRIKNALLKGKFYVNIEYVSKSGMSRKINIGYIYKNNFRHIRNKHILKFACINEKGLIGGCGMDMCFHAQYSLFNKLHRSYKQARYQTRMKTYNTIF